MGETRNAYKILGGKAQSKRPILRPKRRCENDIKVGLKEIGCEGVDWWRTLVNTVMNLPVPMGAGNLLTS
jgi:hypothetical protein